MHDFRFAVSAHRMVEDLDGGEAGGGISKTEVMSFYLDFIFGCFGGSLGDDVGYIWVFSTPVYWGVYFTLSWAGRKGGRCHGDATLM